MSLILIAGPLFSMVVAYLIVLRAGFVAGAAGHDRGLGIGSLGLCILLLLTQAILWVLWGLRIGGVI